LILKYKQTSLNAGKSRKLISTNLRKAKKLTTTFALLPFKTIIFANL
jgi:hypothetical protein